MPVRVWVWRVGHLYKVVAGGQVQDGFHHASQDFIFIQGKSKAI